MVKKTSRKISTKSITYKLVNFMSTWFRSFFVRSKYYFFMVACFAVLMFLSSVSVVGIFELCQFLGM